MRRLTAILASNARWMWTLGAIGVMVLAAVSGGVFWTSLRTDQARQIVEDDRNRSLEMIISANAVETAVLDRQRIIRGFVVSGDASHLDDLADVEGQPAVRAAERLRSLAVSDDGQAGRADRLLDMVSRQSAAVATAAAELPNRRRIDPELLGRMVSGPESERTLSETRDLVRDIVIQERQRLLQRSAVVADIAQSAETYTYAIGIVGLLVIILGGTAVTISLSTTWSSRFRDMERRLDESVRVNEERMRIAHEATGAGTWEYAPDTGDIVWSDEMHRLYGREAGDGVPGGSDWRSLVHEDDVASCPWSGHQPMGVGSFETTFRISTSSGSWRWIVSRGFAFESDGRIRVVGMDVDVTEQVANREELARLNRLLSMEAESDRRDKELVFECAGDLMAVLTPDGFLISANPAWKRILGWEPSDLVGRPMSEFVGHPCGWTVSPSPFPFEMRAFDGAIRTVEWSATDDAKGRLIVSGRDVTDQKESQAKLTEAEEAIRQMQKIETVGQMTGGVAHDFNNMLTPIVGYLDMLRIRHAEDAKSLRMISMAMQSADKARTLVSKLLSFARRQNLEYRVVDAGELVAGMSELVEKTVAGSSVETSIESDDGSVCVRVDPNQFEMVLMNLAVNARDAMPQGGRLRIAVRRALDDCAPAASGLKPGPYVVISVSDTGTGMDQETLRRSIEPFYSTKGVGKGTGLGLSMAHGMAAQSDGALVLESVLGRGTTASIWLPEMDVETMPLAAVEPPSQQRPEGVPLSILLVDDEDIVRGSIEQMLTEMGHSVTTACSGAQALSIVASHDVFDVLVTDYLMPSMTGVQLVERVRELHPAMPSVIVSGYTAVVDQNTLPGTVRLAKPFTSVRLDEAVRRVAPAVPRDPSNGNVVMLSSRRGRPDQG